MKVGKVEFDSITEAVAESQATGDPVIGVAGKVVYAPKDRLQRNGGKTYGMSDLGKENKKYLDSLSPESRHRVLSVFSKKYGMPIKDTMRELIGPNARESVKPLKRNFFGSKKPSATSHDLADRVFEKHGTGIDFEEFKREYKKLEDAHTLKDAPPTLLDLKVMHRNLSGMNWKYPVRKNPRVASLAIPSHKHKDEKKGISVIVGKRAEEVYKFDNMQEAKRKFDSLKMSYWHNKLIRLIADGKVVYVSPQIAKKSPGRSAPARNPSEKYVEHDYKVYVEGVGNVYHGDSRVEAMKKYAEAVEKSKSRGNGRGCGENVAFFGKEMEVIKSHKGWKSRSAVRNPKCKYEVIVGNIGKVFEGSNREEAREMYNTYVRMSKSGKGRPGGEDVVLFCDDEIVKEHIAK